MNFAKIAMYLSRTTKLSVLPSPRATKFFKISQALYRRVVGITCTKSVDLNNLVAKDKSTSWEQAMRTHPVDKLLGQHCFKSAADLLTLVRFHVCITSETSLGIHNVKLGPTICKQVVIGLFIIW